MQQPQKKYQAGGKKPARPAPPSVRTIEDMRARNLPPQDLRAEAAVLGALLKFPATADDLLPELRPEDFYSPAHRDVLDAMLTLWRAGRPVDMLAVADRLRAAGTLEQCGGPVGLAELAVAAPVGPAAARTHAGIVRAMARRRAMAELGGHLVDIAYDPAREPEEFAELAQEAVDGVLAGRVGHGGESPAEWLADYFRYLEELGTNPEQACVDTPFYGLNAVISGFFPGEVCILAGRPSNGKTALALNLACHAVGQGHMVGVFSMEMRKYLLANRIFAQTADVEMRKFRTGRFDDQDWNHMYARGETFRTEPWRIYDKPARRVSDIRAACRRWRREGLRLAVIDYLQLVEPDGRAQNRDQEVAAISRGLKLLAEELGVAVLLLAQLNREVEKRSNKEPILADLRESGSIEQDADTVIFIKPWSDPADVVPVELIVAKGRNSGTGRAKMFYRRNFTRFENPE